MIIPLQSHLACEPKTLTPLPYAARFTPFLKGCSHHLTLPALTHGDKICVIFPVTNLAEIGP